MEQLFTRLRVCVGGGGGGEKERETEGEGIKYMDMLWVIVHRKSVTYVYLQIRVLEVQRGVALGQAHSKAACTSWVQRSTREAEQLSKQLSGECTHACTHVEVITVEHQHILSTVLAGQVGGGTGDKRFLHPCCRRSSLEQPSSSPVRGEGKEEEGKGGEGRGGREGRGGEGRGVLNLQ